MTRKEMLLHRIAQDQKELHGIKSDEYLRENYSKANKYYKCRNSYSCPKTAEDYWWMYFKIIGLKKSGQLEVWSFQKDQDGKIVIETTAHAHAPEYTEITEKEFTAAWSKLLNELLRGPA